MVMRSRLNIMALLVSGLGIGWLVGLSVTPVLNTVLTGVMGVAVAAVGVLMGLPQAEEKAAAVADVGRSTAIPLMMLIVGLSAGATTGLYARVNGWMFSSEQRTAMTRADPTGVQRGTAYAGGGLFTQDLREECERFRLQLEYPEQLQGELASSRDPILRAIGNSTAADSATLVRTVEFACAGT